MVIISGTRFWEGRKEDREPAFLQKSRNPEPHGTGEKQCGGTRFLKEAGFPRTPSGKNFHMASGILRADEDMVKSGFTMNSQPHKAYWRHAQ